MRFSALIALSLASTASARAIGANLVSRDDNCYTDCVNVGLNAVDCGPLNTQCLCTSATFITAVAQCLATTCTTTAEQQAAVEEGMQACSAIGVTEPTVASAESYLSIGSASRATAAPTTSSQSAASTKSTGAGERQGAGVITVVTAVMAVTLFALAY